MFFYSELKIISSEIIQKIEKKKIAKKNTKRLLRPIYFSGIIIHGKLRMIQVFHGRFVALSRGLYTPEWQCINVIDDISQADYKKKPKNLKATIDLVELLGKNFDFIRVDLYLLDKHIYFEKKTNYPKSGGVLFNPESFDFELGSQ